MYSKRLQLRNGATAHRRIGASAQRQHLRSDVITPSQRDMLRRLLFSSHSSFTSFLLCLILIFSIINAHSLHANVTNNTSDTKTEISHSPHTKWPSKEYLEIRELIENGNNDRAIQTISKAFSGVFPYRVSVTNGYPMAFFYYDALADAYMNVTNYVDAIDTYRQALICVSDTVITQHPIAYAKTLQKLGKAFFKLRRFTDAESLFVSATKLVESPELESDIYFTRCIQAAHVMDWEDAADNAEKCIEINPDYNTEAFHYLAVNQFSHRKYEEAIETWLTGLYGIPLDNIEEYLDICLQYFRNIHEKQIVSYYDALTFLAMRETAINSLSAIRVLSERIKLQKLYPELFKDDTPSDIIYKGESIFTSFNELPEMQWIPRDHPVLSINYSLLHTNAWERKINRTMFLTRCSEENEKYAIARDILDEMLLHEKALTEQTVTINDWTLLFYAHFYRAYIDKKAYFHDEHTRSNKNISIEKCKEMLNKGTAGRGKMHEVFVLNTIGLSDLFINNQTNKLDKTISYCKSLFPQSDALLKLENYKEHQKVFASPKNNIIENIIALVSEGMKKPNYYPEETQWKSWCDALLKINTLLNKDTNETEIIRYVIDTYFDGLKHSVADFNSREKLFGTSKRYGIKSLLLLQELMKYEKDGYFNADDYNKLRDFLYKYGVCIPADAEHVKMLKKIIALRKKYDKMAREYDVELTILCDAKPWGDETENVYLWTDIDNTLIEMRHTDTQYIWGKTVTVPKDMYVVQFEFYKNKNDIPEKNTGRRIVINNEEEGEMTVKKTVLRDTPATVTFYCDTRNYDVDSLYINGSISQLGVWKVKNMKKMSDDGKTNGDEKAGDKIFTYQIKIPAEIREFKYIYVEESVAKRRKYTRPQQYRTYSVPDTYNGENIIKNVYRTKI